MVKNVPAHAGDAGSIPGPGGSPGEGTGTLQDSCLENPMDGWRSLAATAVGSQRVGQD